MFAKVPFVFGVVLVLSYFLVFMWTMGLMSKHPKMLVVTLLVETFVYFSIWSVAKAMTKKDPFRITQYFRYRLRRLAQPNFNENFGEFRYVPYAYFSNTKPKVKHAKPSPIKAKS